MKNMPILDPRDTKDILDQIKKKAENYTPEWKFDEKNMDAGVAIASIFANMFSQTLDRYNDILYKNYIEFLNLLNARQKPVTPATGYVAINVAKGMSRPVELEKDTVFFHDSADKDRIIYQSDETIFAVDADINSIFSVVPSKDAIAKVDINKKYFEVFNVEPEDNLQIHSFELIHSEAFDVSVPCTITVELCHNMDYIAQLAAQRLSDRNFARFEYFDGEKYIEFKNVTSEGNKIYIEKPNFDAMIYDKDLEPEPESEFENYAIRCVMQKFDNDASLEISAIKVATKLNQGEYIHADLLYLNDTALEIAAGAYCFDEQMTIYDDFYIGLKQVFNKRDAQIVMELDMASVIRQSDQQQELYEFKKKMVIDKSDNKNEMIKKYISKVIWEYFNGIGWTNLEVQGDVNPFDLNCDGIKRITFICPSDIEQTVVGASESFFIRARIARIENAYDIYAVTIMPLIKSARFSYEYKDTKFIQGISGSNNLNEYEIFGIKEAMSNFVLYKPIEDINPALYLCFDLPVWGYPLNMYFEMVGTVHEERALCLEVFDGVKFVRLKMVSEIKGFKKSGLISVFAPDIMKKTMMFGQEGYFMRICDMNNQWNINSYPKIGKIILNAVHITQREISPVQYFSTLIHDASKEIVVDDIPILDCDVWVDEINSIASPKRQEMIEKIPDDIEEIYSDDMQLINFFVRYNQTDNLAKHGESDRVYEVDGETGRISFGDGNNGCIVPQGDDNIKVIHSFGGGAKGNIMKNEMTGIQTVQAGITGINNFVPMCGGNDLQSVQVVEELGVKRLKHRARAVTASDFECLIKEEFSQVKDAKCFPNTDKFAQENSGYVTVVVLTSGYTHENHTLSMCQRMRDYICERCDGALVDEKLTIMPAQVMTVNVTAYVELEVLGQAAATEKEIIDYVNQMLDPFSNENKSGIGSIPDISDFYNKIKRIKNVQAVNNVLLEGSYFDHNVQKVVALDVYSKYLFAVPKSGKHIIHI